MFEFRVVWTCKEYTDDTRCRSEWYNELVMDANSSNTTIDDIDTGTEDSTPVEPAETRDYGDQGENGYDLSAFRENLRLTPTERIEKLERALEVYFEVKRAGEKYRLSGRNSSAR